MLTKVDVVRLLDETIRKLPWIQEPKYRTRVVTDRFTVEAVGTGYLIILEVEDTGRLGHFLIRNSSDSVRSVTLQNEEDIEVFFNESILPVMMREYYCDVSRNLINAISKEIRASGKKIRQEQWVVSTRGMETGRSVAFGDIKVMFSYNGDEKFPILEYDLNGIVTKYNPVTLSEDFKSIKETLISKTKQYIESIN